MSVDRHTLERANWLTQHAASWHQGDRRMAQRLKRRARRLSQAESDAADSAHGEAPIKWLGARFVARGEDGTDQFLRAVLLWAVLVPAFAVTVGAAVLLSKALYAAAAEAALRMGRIPRSWSWYAAAGVWFGAALVYWIATRGGQSLWTVRVWPELTVDVDWAGVSLAVLLTQVTFALALTAWQIRRHGWPGVKTRKLRGFGGEHVPVASGETDPVFEEEAPLTFGGDDFESEASAALDQAPADEPEVDFDDATLDEMEVSR